MTTSSGQATPTKYCARQGSFSTIGTRLRVLPCCCIGRDARRLYQPTLFCEGVVPVPPRPVVLLALSFCLSPRSAAAGPWTAARDALARLFSATETCELGGEVVGGQVEPGTRAVVVPTRKKAWEASLGGEEAAKPYIKARLAGWPERLLADREALPRTDAEFVARLARDTWRGLEAFTDREHQLPVDNVRPGSTSAGRDEARVGDYTNVTSIGLRLIAIVAAHELGLATEREAVGRLRALLDTVGRLETYGGFFLNY